MKNKICLILGLIVLGILIPACNRSTKISGRVLDMSGKPVEGAKVTLNRSEEIGTTETAANGSYNLYDIPITGEIEYKLSVTKDGFRVNEQYFKNQQELAKDRDIVLMEY